MAALTAENSPGLSIDFLPSVDLTSLTQSELRALSSCSSSSFDPGRTDGIPTPAVDRSSFNESAGSHRQTYSRPFTYHHHHHHHRHRLAAPPSPRPPTSNDSLIDYESHSIVTFLKQLLSSHPGFQELNLVDSDSFSHLNDAINFSSHNGSYRFGEKKRKRGRKLKLKALLNMEEKEKEIEKVRVREIGLEIVNINGVVVDLVSLASMGDPYKNELSRRTQGMDTDEELLGFFRDLGGYWCSRRRKRKIVDAGEFGDALPVGWKLLLGIRRKEGRAWVYCRRYISPGGQHFVSCKEVSKYLQSIFGNYDGQQIHEVVSESCTGTTRNEGDHRQSGEHEKAVPKLGTKNFEMAEVQIHDIFECYQCNMVFYEKDAYLEHLLSFHERTTRKYRIGSSVSDGVIIKDGKFECQFCHKVFDEKRRYNSHVGIHVRNYIRGIEESPADRMALKKTSDSPTNNKLPARISRMDALIEIAQGSNQEASPGLNGETSGTVTVDQNATPNPKLLASVSDHMIVDEITPKIGHSDSVLENETNSSGNEQHGNGAIPLHEKERPVLSTVEIDKFVIEAKTGCECRTLAPLNNQKLRSTQSNVNLVFVDKDDRCNNEDEDKTSCAEIEAEFRSNGRVADKTLVEETIHQSLKEDGLPNGLPMLSIDSMQPPPTFSATIVSLDETDPSEIVKQDDRATGFEDLKLEAIEQLKFGFNSEIEVPVDLVNNSEMDRMFDSSVQFETGITVVDAGSQGLTSQCIWCGIEFNHEGADTEFQSDSVGYMCPTCKDKISGPL